METSARRSAATTTAAGLQGFEEEIRRRFSAEEAEPMIAFARGLFARHGAAYVAELPEEDVIPLAASAFRFFAEMTAPVRCRLWNPTFAVDGWDSPYTIFESHLADRPFIVDTLAECFHERKAVVRHLLHPIYSVEREPNGRLLRIRSLDASARRESFVHGALDKLPDAELPALQSELEERLGEVVLATDDYRKMLERVEAVSRELDARRAVLRGRDAEIDEARAFLDWLRDQAFVFLGFRSYRLVGDPRAVEVEPGSGLGILRAEERSRSAARRLLDELPPALAERMRGGPLLAVGRANAESRVHRRALMDSIVVQRFDEGGRRAGEHRILGLFTSKAYADESAEVPLLRVKLREILAAEQLLPDSHDYKEVVAIFDSIPKTELFALTVEELRADIRTILSMQPTENVRVTIRPDALGRGLSVMLILPRERFSAQIRREVQELLEERFGAAAADYQLALGTGDYARLHFFLSTPVASPEARAADLEREIAERVRSWDDRLRERLLAEHSGARGRELADRYAALFTAEYKASTDVPAAVNDVRQLEALARTGATQVDLSNGIGRESDRFTTLKLYLRGEPLVLSDFLPVLENLGLRVFAEDSVTLGEEDGRVFLHRFQVQDREGRRLDVRKTAALLGPAILEVRAGRAESDALNRLVIDAGLSWREVDVLRTYRNAAFQMGTAPSRGALNDALTRHPASARALFELFAARFGPREPDRAASQQAARGRFLQSLDVVQTSGEDRMLRTYLALVEATLRTNYFQAARVDSPYVAVKLDCQALDFLPRPRPLYEVYVHSARMEGVHLRGGKIARGGIRFSDRHDDFRTEILGLMKTQMVKNAVIVPVGSKGGFIVKRPRPGEDGAEEVRRCYATLMRGLLDLTDNVVQGVVVPPKELVRYDGDDPYLVIAADKGTATFSDLANSIAEEYGFWLGDAFASGGSHGYDHKREAITARGAWACVERHFRELGKDLRESPFTVVGIGDMSGDVFGNGMLQSRKIRLRAAFDHRHVFLDPDPDPEVSFAERERLFKLPRSSWADYDPTKLGAGGAVIPRSAKTAPLSAEVRALLGVSAESLDGEGLVRAVLSMETDLLFNGGVGTYVRASNETNAEVGDPANDQVRITAAQLRAAVIAEGGNLGLTQRARIEAALRGVRLDTDAIDNSAGVDLSDHEVNLKILLRPLLEAGELSLKQRDRVLEQAKPAVIQKVLEHNVRQALLLSIDQLRSRTRLVEFRDQMVDLEQEGLLDRALEALPDRETLRLRRSTFLGLTRPELAVLSAYSKLSLQHHLIACRWIDDPYLERTLSGYFPQAIVERFPDAIRQHRLRREILALELTNQVIDRMGAAFAQRMARDTGADPASAVAAWTLVMAITEADRLFDAVAAAPIRPDDAYALCLRWEAAVESACKFLVHGPIAGGTIAERIERWRKPIAELADLANSVFSADTLADVRKIEQTGLAGGLARSLVALDSLRQGLEIVCIAEEGAHNLVDAAFAYQQVGRLLDFAGIERWLAAVPGDDRWEKRAAEGLREDVTLARRQMTAVALSRPEGDVAERLRAFATANEAELARVRGLGEDLRSGRKSSMAAMVVIVRELRRLTGRV